MGWCLAIGAGRHFPTSHLPILLVLMLRDRSNQPVSLKRFTTIPTRRPAVKKALSEKALSKRIVGRYDALRQRSTTPHPAEGAAAPVATGGFVGPSPSASRITRSPTLAGFCEVTSPPFRFDTAPMFPLRKKRPGAKLGNWRGIANRPRYPESKRMG